MTPDPLETVRAPLTADELEVLRRTCEQARNYWAIDLADDEARENWEFYGSVLRLIHHYRPPS